jgi:hypothetical protein
LSLQWYAEWLTDGRTDAFLFPVEEKRKTTHEAEPHGRDKRQMPNVVFSIWHSGDFSLARRDKRQTPNTEYTIINAVNKILIVLGQICVASDVGHRSLTHKH